MALFTLMLLAALVLAAVLLLAVIAGVVTGAVGIASFGVLFTSIIIGLVTGRTSEAVRALLVQCGALLGAGAGLACAWLLHMMGYARFQSWTLFAYAGLAGAVIGVVAGVLLSRLVIWVVERQRVKTG